MRRDASHVRTLFILKLYGFQLKFKSKWNGTFQLELQIFAKTPGQLVYSFQFVGLISRLVCRERHQIVLLKNEIVQEPWRELDDK